MKKGVVLLTVLVLAVFVAGCKEKPAFAAENPFIGGTNALTLSFVSNSPPVDIFDKSNTQLSPFNIIVNIENVGESSINEKKMKLTLSGIYSGDFVDSRNAANPLTFDVYPVWADNSLPQVANLKVLEGKKKGQNKEVIPGGKTQYSWESLAYNKELKGTLPNIPIEVSACYEYTTKAVGMYCLRKEPLSLKKGVCEVDGTKTVYNSAAPVQVTGFSEGAAGISAILFSFEVKKVGAGEVSKPDLTTATGYIACSSSYADKNKVYVKVDSSISGALSCTGLTGGSTPAPGEISTSVNGYLTLDSVGQGIFSCRLNTKDVSGDAVKDLNIDLVYNYEEKISRAITIKHLLS